MPPKQEDDTGALERARERLYAPNMDIPMSRTPLSSSNVHEVPHEWGNESLPRVEQSSGKRHIRLASIFLVGAFLFFLFSLGIAGYFFYSGGNTVSVDKIIVDINGPTTIAGGDTVPLSIVITNRNPTTINNVTMEIDFPDGTRSAVNVLQSYPRYTENLGPLAGGETITRSVKAVIFGGTGQSITLPISVSFRTPGSNSVFVKKSSYEFSVSSTPLSLSVDTLSETVSGAPMSVVIEVRSNATVPLSNVVLSGAFPFGFSVTSSSAPINNSSFLLGTLKQGESKSITVNGVLVGQDREQRVLHFTVGTAKSATDQTLAVKYMEQSATISITSPFINATLAINGDTRKDIVINPGNSQSATVSYTNTLATSITNAVVTVGVSGSAIDYDSIRSSNGFYNSSNRTIVFSKDTDPSLSQLSPDAVGIGAFTFSTLPAESLPSSPTAVFNISVSGTRVGQTNVPEDIRSSATKTVKVATTVILSSYSLYTSGSNSGPVPPRANKATTYTIVWNAQNKGSAVAGGVVTATLPSYVSYTGQTSGAGAFSYNEKSRTVTWTTGDLMQNRNIQGSFQVSVTPSTSQRGSAPALVSPASFSGHDRFANVDVSASAEPATTETTNDLGYVAGNGVVQ